jgi:hypothetical protein
VRTIEAFEEFFDPARTRPVSTSTVCRSSLHEQLHQEAAFPHSVYTKLPFKTQIDFLNSLRARDALQLADHVNYSTRTMSFGSADSKSIVWNSNGIIYDIASHWLRRLPHTFTDVTRSQHNTQEFSNCFFSRANLSFSHFVATDLAQILIVDKYLASDIPIVSPWLTSWQRSLLNFFGVQRKSITLAPGSQVHQVLDASFSCSFAIEDIHEYEGLVYCRNLAQSLLPVHDFSFSSDQKPIVWLGRYHYEKSRGLPPRILNIRDLMPLLKMHSMIYLDPSTCSLLCAADLVSNAKLIVSESGSHFINYLLFARQGVPIIQLSPCGCLGPTWSYYNVNNMQWYYPVRSHLYFYEGMNQPQTQRRYGSPWNTPSSYDPLVLEKLISSLLVA